MIEDVPDEMRKHILENVPMHKLGEPETINAALDFVLSDGANFYTGQTLNLNGGLFG